MDFMKDLQKLPLGLPLSVASVGTVATIFAGKNLHVGFGAALTVLSLLHGFQHMNKMKTDMQKWGSSRCPVGQCLLGRKEEPAGQAYGLQDFLAATEIACFTPGRLRVYNLALAGNETLASQLENYVKSFAGVRDAQANTLTGSFLIQYDPAELRKVPGLARLEERIAALAPQAEM